jgi:dimethylglycine dehydrogenase
MGYVPAELAQGAGGLGGGFEIDILGDRRKARLQREPLFDPKRERMTG